MKLPPPEFRLPPWQPAQMQVWKSLASKVRAVAAHAGQGDAFEAMKTTLLADIRKASIPRDRFKSALCARVLSWIWLNEEHTDKRVFSSRWLMALYESQQLRLTTMTLLQLLWLYFKYFDSFDKHGDFRETLERVLRIELGKPRGSRLGDTTNNPIIELGKRPHLLQLDGPAQLVKQCIAQHRDLDAVLEDLGLQQTIDGRYGDVCRAQYYLETLRTIPEGEHDPVLDELLKPQVHSAPYQQGKTIGVEALAILIDRSTQAHDLWQAFILKLAGDPRITFSTGEYQKWWGQLGGERVRKVRSWLSRMDLRLFLQAVESYARDSHNEDQLRMFPARKRFMQGLLKLNLVRNTRLFLGDTIYRQIARDLKDQDLLQSITGLSDRRDTAVLYLDCGDFHLIEGSHNFKLWVYLAQPAQWLDNYRKHRAQHAELTTMMLAAYKQAHPGRPYQNITHRDHVWQNKLFVFLGEQGIRLDMEQLLSPQDYRYQIQNYDVPHIEPRGVVRSTNARSPNPQYRPFRSSGTKRR